MRPIKELFFRYIMFNRMKGVDPNATPHSIAENLERLNYIQLYKLNSGIYFRDRRGLTVGKFNNLIKSGAITLFLLVSIVPHARAQTPFQVLQQYTNDIRAEHRQRENYRQRQPSNFRARPAVDSAALYQQQIDDSNRRRLQQQQIRYLGY